MIKKVALCIQRNRSVVQVCVTLLFVLYLFVLVKLVIFKYPVDPTIENALLTLSNGNYVPFRTILGYLSGEPTWHIAIRNLAGNLFLFVPFGVFLPLIFHVVRWRGVLIAVALFSLLLECMQIFFIGTPDIDDVLLNALGALSGYMLFCWSSKMWRYLLR